MEEITIRFEIVRLAVKMADHDTISIQAQKLRSISLDADLNEIIALLESRNYRQALSLMKGYMSSLEESFFDPIPAVATSKSKKTQEQPLESQNLFDMMSPATTQTINLDDMLRMTEESAEETVSYQSPQQTTSETYIQKTKEEVHKHGDYLNTAKNSMENKTIKHVEKSIEDRYMDEFYDPISDSIAKKETLRDKHIEKTELLSVVDNLSSNVRENTLEKTPQKSRDIQDELIEEKEILKQEKVENTLPDEREVLVKESIVEPVVKTDELEVFQIEDIVQNEELSTLEIPIVESLDISNEVSTEDVVETPFAEEPSLEYPEEDSIEDQEFTEELYTTEKEESFIHEEVTEKREQEVVQIDTDMIEESSTVRSKEDYLSENRRYPPISYIDQKFRNMRHQFPQIESIEEITPETQSLLKQIATKGYSENDVKEMITQFQKKKEEGQKAEAAEILLIAAASESKYAQLLLARELFRGEVLKIDYPEAFTQINRLAEYDYPEAICDLAQLYEYGYGIKKDRKTALLLYEEALAMGVKRAQKHVERLTYKKGLLGTLFKR